MSSQTKPLAPPRPGVVAAAWAVVLALSLLPVIVAQELLHQPVPADLRAGTSVAILLACLAATLAWAPGRALRPVLVLFLVLVVAQWVAHEQLDRLPFLAGRLRDPAFAVFMPVEQGLNLVVTLVIIGALLVLKRDRRAFYLAKGDPSAPAAPIPWMGVGEGTRWSTLGPTLSIAITGGTLAFLVLSGTPSLDGLARAIPSIPVVLACAALNALNEEVTYKAGFLSVLLEPVGARNALRMVAAYFGLAHFYGVPYGIVGVVLAWFLGWILARSMLETRGLWWAWWIHFLQDVVIFGFLVVGAITPGG
ncbi:MAG TPA: CPBP family intramembrane glutamic endopeptidase [Candidatus Limnocylindrales bacterium]|nr:CPBP family intramembrane glutamic endopeptidase [Candidatus Limnocylindrales bacterium]